MVAPCLAWHFLDKAEGRDEVLWDPAPFPPDCMTDRSKVTLLLSASQGVEELLSLLSVSVTCSERMNRAQLSSEIYSLLTACDLSEHRNLLFFMMVVLGTQHLLSERGLKGFSFSFFLRISGGTLYRVPRTFSSCHPRQIHLQRLEL